MASKINGLIQPQNYELIRDKLAVILMEELINQGSISSPQETFAKGVWVERVIPFDQPTNFPCINIILDNGEYSNKDQKMVDGWYKFYICAYTSSKSTANDKGDTLAKIKLHKLLGLCRAILENPVYNTLDYPEIGIKTTKVGSIIINQPENQNDATNAVVGYLEFFVRVAETVILKDPIPLALSSTTVRLYDTNEGYMWGDMSTPPDTFITDEDDTYFIAENYLNMATIKFSDLTNAPAFAELDFIAGVRDNGDGSFTNFKYTTEDITNQVLSSSRMLITASEDGDDLFDSWLDGKDIQVLFTDKAAYLRDIDFTQTGGIITGVTISFYTGQKIYAQI